MFTKFAIVALLGVLGASADTNLAPVTNRTVPTALIESPIPARREPVEAPAVRAEKVRTECVEGRRFVCGRVLAVSAAGLVVDSGYSALLNPPFNQSWVVRRNASVSRDSAAVEEKRPDAMCIGQVFLSDIPKRPEVKVYDYVVLHAYPAGQEIYRPVPGIEKKLRRFSASLERAVKWKLEDGEK